MKSNKYYMPILRSKAGELDALSGLSSEIKNFVVPLLCVHPVPLKYPKIGLPAPGKTLQKHLSDLAKNIYEAWGEELPLFIDFDLPANAMVSQDVHYLPFFFDLLKEKQIKFIPTVGLDRDEDQNFMLSLKKYVPKVQKELCVRLQQQDIELYIDLSEKIENLLKNIGVVPRDVHLVFDLRSIEQEMVGEKCSDIANAFSSVPNIVEFKSVTVASTGVPKDMSKFKTDTQSAQPRIDYQLWLELKKLNLPRNPSYSDYGIVNPDAAEVDPRKMSRSARIRYTTDSDWTIIKGKGYKKASPTDQNHKLAEALVSQKIFMGAKHCSGDTFIEKCAQKKVGPGNAQMWVEAETNHHITHVIGQLSKLID